MRGKKINWRENLEIFKAIHDNKYIYDKTILLDAYINSHQKIKIVCPIHGEFIQKICAHKRNQCPKCAMIEVGKNNSHSKEIFIEKAVLKHGNLYDYEYVIYKNNRTKVKIFCKKCKKIFEQTPGAHSNGEECKICAYEKQGKLSRKTILDFIKQAKEIHGDKYDYSEVIYNGCEKKIKIKCNICNNIFYPTPNNHLSKTSGCMRCAILNKTGENSATWNPNLTREEREFKRDVPENNIFIKTVLKRDNETCQITKKTDGILIVHHLNGYHWFKEGRFDPNNGITLSIEIHDLFHIIYGMRNNTFEQFEEFVESLYLLL